MEVDLAKALVKFRGKVQTIAFDSANSHFKNKFASLAAIHKSVDPILNECGLTIMQIPTNPAEGNAVGIITAVIHESGQTESSTFFLPVVKNDPQGVGSAITYARRYALSAVLGLVTDEDEDGNAASSGSREAVAKAGKPKPARSKAKAPAMTKESRDKLKATIDARIMSVGTPDHSQGFVLALVTKALGYSSPIEMKDQDFSKAMEEVGVWVPSEGDGAPAEGGE